MIGLDRSKSILFTAVAAFFGLASTSALATTITLGDQDFANGSLVNGAAAFAAPQAGEPAPIGVFIGSDFGPSFSASWTFGYAPGSASSASITIGIFDHDSAAAGDQVAFFGVDGVDLTSGLNTLFESFGGTQAEDNVYTLALSGAALAALADGSATFTLTLKGPGLQGIPGACCSTTSGNGAGLDFTSLTVNRAAVPEPSSVALLGLGMLGFAFSRRRRSVR